MEILTARELFMNLAGLKRATNVRHFVRADFTAWSDCRPVSLQPDLQRCNHKRRHNNKKWRRNKNTPQQKSAR